MLAGGKADIMLSGGRTQFIALKAKTPWLDINQERHTAYAGYDGMVELVRQIDLAHPQPGLGGRCARPRRGTFPPAAGPGSRFAATPTSSRIRARSSPRPTADDMGEC